jgi:hypothetical protein
VLLPIEVVAQLYAGTGAVLSFDGKSGGMFNRTRSIAGVTFLIFPNIGQSKGMRGRVVLFLSLFL